MVRWQKPVNLHACACAVHAVGGRPRPGIGRAPNEGNVHRVSAPQSRILHAHSSLATVTASYNGALLSSGARIRSNPTEHHTCAQFFSIPYLNIYKFFSLRHLIYKAKDRVFFIFVLLLVSCLFSSSPFLGSENAPNKLLITVKNKYLLKCRCRDTHLHKNVMRQPAAVIN